MDQTATTRTVKVDFRKMNHQRTRHAFRLWNENTQMYLHMDGVNETADIMWSWSGFGHQAETLQKRATARGDDWPYIRAALNQEAA